MARRSLLPWYAASVAAAIAVAVFACGQAADDTCDNLSTCTPSGDDGGASGPLPDATGPLGESAAPIECPRGCAPGTACVDASCACTTSSGCAGCCSGVACVADAGTFPACGTGGQACATCDPTTSDHCAADGTCACGSGAACSGVQTCCGGACVDLSGDTANCGTCGHACSVGICAQSSCQPVSIYTQAKPCALTYLGTRTDLTPTALFWVGCVSTDAGAGTTIFSCDVGKNCATPRTLSGDFAVDAGSGPPSYTAFVWITPDQLGYTIHNLPSGDSVIEDVLPFGFGVTASAPKGAYGLAADVNYAFWGNGGFLWRYNIADQTKTSMMPAGSGSGIALDAFNVYTGLGLGGLVACPLASPTGCGEAPTVVYGGSSVSAFAPDTKSQVVYVSDGEAIYACAPSGGCTAAKNTWFTGGAAIAAITVDAASVYWIDVGTSSSGSVKKCAIGAACTAPVTLATGPMGNFSDGPWFAQDKDAVYWSTRYGIWEVSH